MFLDDAALAAAALASSFFFFQPMKPPIRKRKTNTVMTIPAMAPPERPPLSPTVGAVSSLPMIIVLY